MACWVDLVLGCGDHAAVVEPLPAPECRSCVSRDVVIEELTVASARLAERVAEWERIVGRNSGNSSTLPSSDDLLGKKKPAPKPVRESGRARGEQKDAPGRSLPWVATPEEYVAHRPEGECGCGAEPAEAAEVGMSVPTRPTISPEIRVRVC